MVSASDFLALSGSMKDFRHLPGTNLLDRVAAFYAWQEARREIGVWPLGRSTEQGAFSRCTARTDEGALFAGVNFASQDYLSLNSHPEILETGIQALRDRLMHNIQMLRKMLGGCGMETYGDPSAIVCVKMGTEPLARLVARRLPMLGMLANLVEFPAVPKGQARFRLQVMANHSMHDIVDAVHRLSAAASDGAADLAALETGAITLTDLAGSPGYAPVSEAQAKAGNPAFTTIADEVRRAVG